MGNDEDDAPARQRRPKTASAGVLAGVLGVGLLATACSGPSPSPTVANLGSTSTTGGAAAGSSAGGTTLAQLVAYAACMRNHGIHDFPDPTPGPNGQGGGFSIRGGQGSDLDPSSPRYNTADQACKALLPSENLTPAQTTKLIADEVKLAECMRSHGVFNWPDPNSQGAFHLVGITPVSPQVRPALNTCKALTHFQGPMRVEVTNAGSG